MHNLQGTTVVQKAGTDNWIHLPVTAPWFQGRHNEHVIGFAFRAALNENARIDIVRLSDAGGGLGRGGPDFEDRVSFVGAPVVYEHETPFNTIWESGRLISIHVEYLTGTPTGRIEFRGGDLFTLRN